MLLARICGIQTVICEHVIMACAQTPMEHLSRIIAEQAGDTIFSIDRIAEDILLSHFEQLRRDWSFVLIVEGIGESGILVFPPETDPNHAELRIIVDPNSKGRF